MNQDEIREKLQAMGFYQEELLQELIKQGKLQSLSPGELQIEEGKFLKTIPLVLEGQLRVYKSSEEAREVLLYYLMALQCCPMSIGAVYQNQLSLVNSIAMEPSLVLEVPVSLVDSLMVYQSWRKFILSNLIEAYQELIELYTQVVFKNLDERILTYLQKKTDINPRTSIPISHEELAKEMGTSREVISRVLKRLEQEAKIKLSHRSITLLN